MIKKVDANKTEVYQLVSKDYNNTYIKLVMNVELDNHGVLLSVINEPDARDVNIYLHSIAEFYCLWHSTLLLQKGKVSGYVWRTFGTTDLINYNTLMRKKLVLGWWLYSRLCFILGKL